MTREIKFRIWCEFERKMLSDVYLMNGFTYRVSGQNLTALAVGEDRRKMMQFTGLKDVNGTEIYESDIVRTADNGNPLIKCQVGWQEYSHGEIKWLRFGFNICQKRRGSNELHYYAMLSDEGEPAALEVIGNIYEHPELIK